MVKKVRKIIKGLEKASKTHKKQAETLKKHVASMKKPKPKTNTYSAVVINVKLIQGKPTSI